MRKLLFWLLVIANLFGAAYGTIFYYSQALLSTNPFLWVFVPDCPFYSFLFAIVLLLAYFRKRIDWLYFLSFVGALKYGFWTVFALTTYLPYYHSPEYAFGYALVFIAHIALFFEAFLLLGKIELKKYFIALSLFWFLLNDFFDYVFLTHPALPQNSLGFMFPATVAMSIAFTFIAYYLNKKMKKPPIELLP